jgi:nicotinamide-nucleotide amidase
MINAEIITIGDELLIGQVIDTNSAFIGQELNKIGIRVSQRTAIGDDAKQILTALKDASQRAKVVVITGGLGPTKDDITKKTICEYFNSSLRFDEGSFQIIESLFRARGRQVTEINKQQAEVPSNCTVMLNRNGTAPGMMFDEKGILYFSMPGVPSEMKSLMTDSVIPILKERFSLTPIIHRTILTQGIPESFLAEKIADWEDNLPPNLKLAYLPAAGMVRLRITGSGTDEIELKAQVQEAATKLNPLIDEYIFGYEDDKLEAIVGRLLLEKRKTIGTAESCTGGYIAHKITSVPGSSEYYQGSIVAYSNLIKVKDLGVEMNVLEMYGAVSEETVSAMARNAIKVLQSDYIIATSGIAGPGGGTPLKPVGTVWLAIANENKVYTKKLQLGNNREKVIHETSLYALNMLRKILLGRTRF